VRNVRAGLVAGMGGDAWEWGLPGLYREVARDWKIYSPALGLEWLTAPLKQKCWQNGRFNTKTCHHV